MHLARGPPPEELTPVNLGKEKSPLFAYGTPVSKKLTFSPQDDRDSFWTWLFPEPSHWWIKIAEVQQYHAGACHCCSSVENGTLVWYDSKGQFLH